ncbi:MAG TPA: DNA polymerase III subunit beta [Candidatus Acidoferrales bacterium]|nr:DNA polymerase III subunit beta [Candidatus Acidoferrales bacterium]
MQVKANRKQLLETLYWTQSIVERRHTMPILANVLVEAEKGEVRVTATDLEVGVRSRVEAEVSKEGAITLNAKKFYEIVREAPEENLEFRRLENDWVELKSGRTIFKIVGMDAREFPQFPTFAADQLLPIPAGVVREMIEKTIFAVSSDETRHNLNGVYVEEREAGKLSMVATDGHRLALIERDTGSLDLKKGVILPRKGLAELKKILDETADGLVAIAIKENMALVAREPVELFMRLIDADFPDYTKVVPKENPVALKVGQGGFLQALRRVAILSNERYKGIKLDIKERRMTISATNPDLGEAVEELEIDYQGRPLTLGFNARYLIDVLGVLGEASEVDVRFKDELSPGVIKKEGDEGYLYVVMPMRL